MGSGTVRRIVLTGPECTGKSTLAARLASDTGAAFVMESARAYAEAAQRALTVDDVEPIAREHIAREGAALAASPSSLVLDTDLISTIVYGRHYYGFRSEFIESAARARLGDLYLLCAPDIPWSADGIRDRPGDRREMFAEFRAALDEFGARYTEITGSGDARYASVKAAIAAFGPSR